MNTHRLMLWFRVRNLVRRQAQLSKYSRYEGRPSPRTCSQRIFSFENSTEYFNVGPAPHLRSIILPIQAHRRPRYARRIMYPHTYPLLAPQPGGADVLRIRIMFLHSPKRPRDDCLANDFRLPRCLAQSKSNPNCRENLER